MDPIHSHRGAKLIFSPSLPEKILHCVSPLLNSLSIGYAQGYSAVAISKMELHFGPDVIDVDAQSWIGSLVSVGLMVGSLVGGFLSDFFSEKICFLITSPFILGGWISIFCTGDHSLVPMYAGRFLTGFGTGTHFPLVHSAMSTVSSKELRGVVTALAPLCAVTGMLVAYIVGILVDWDVAAIFGLVFPFAANFALPLMLTERELHPHQQQHHYHSDSAPSSWIDSVRRHGYIIKPILITSTIFLLQAFTGAHTISYYTGIIFSDFISDKNVQNISIVVIGVAYVIGYVSATAFFLKRFKRRTLLVVSSSVMALSTAVVAMLDHVFHDSKSAAVNASTVSFLAVFVLAYSVGLGPIPYIYLGEFFPPSCKGFSTGVVSLLQWSFNCLSLKSFPYMLRDLGLVGAFYFSSGVCLAAAVFACLAVPETKDLSVQEIESKFRLMMNKDAQRDDLEPVRV